MTANFLNGEPTFLAAVPKLNRALPGRVDKDWAPMLGVKQFGYEPGPGVRKGLLSGCVLAFLLLLSGKPNEYVCKFLSLLNS